MMPAMNVPAGLGDRFEEVKELKRRLAGAGGQS
jgi:hypothetical protein